MYVYTHIDQCNTHISVSAFLYIYICTYVCAVHMSPFLTYDIHIYFFVCVCPHFLAVLLGEQVGGGARGKGRGVAQSSERKRHGASVVEKHKETNYDAEIERLLGVCVHLSLSLSCSISLCLSLLLGVLLSSFYRISTWLIPLQMLRPQNTPNRKTQISGYKLKFDQDLNLNMYRATPRNLSNRWIWGV